MATKKSPTTTNNKATSKTNDLKKHGDMLAQEPDAIHFVNEAYKHCKAIAAEGDGIVLLKKTYLKDNIEGKDKDDNGVLVDKSARNFIAAIAQHRFWDREEQRKVPA